MNKCMQSLTPFLITPNDTENFKDAHGRQVITKAISFGGQGGALSIETFTGETVIIPSGSLAVGVMHYILARKVHVTGTTATDIVGYAKEASL